MRRILLTIALLACAVPSLAQRPTGPTVPVLAPMNPSERPASLTPDVERKAQTFYEEGWKDLSTESFEKAVAAFSQATTLNPQFKLAFYGLGKAHMGLKHFPEATGAYERARALYSQQLSSHFANAAEADRIWENELRELEPAIQRSGGKDPMLRQEYENIQAQRNMVRGVDMRDPVPAFLHVALGSAYFRTDRLPDAEQEYKAAVASNPKAGEAWNNLAVVYLMTNRVDDAEHAVESAEKAGFHVPSGLKDDIKKKKGS